MTLPGRGAPRLHRHGGPGGPGGFYRQRLHAACVPTAALLILGVAVNMLHWPLAGTAVALAAALVAVLLTWRPRRWVAPVVGAILAAALLSQQRWQSGDSLTALIAIASCLKLGEAERSRDVAVALVGGIWLTALGCLWEPGAAMLGAVAGAGLLLVVALAALEGRSRLPGALRALALALPMTAILFAFTPRVTGDLGVLAFALGLPLVIETEVEKNRTPIDNQLSMGEVAERAGTDARVLVASFYNGAGGIYDGVPPLGDLYWRGPVLWTYQDGQWLGRKGWEQRGARMRGRIRMKALKDELREAGKLSFYDMTIFPHRTHWLYAHGFPAAVPPSSFVSRDWQLQNMNPVREVLHYPMMSWVDVQSGVTLSDEDRALALALPETAEPRTRALAAEIAVPDDPLATARAGVRLLEEGYGYNKSIRDPGGENPVDRFLFDIKIGFAGHFASAYAVLMRASGIPARLVSGYRGGVHLGLTNRVFVMEKDAYVWTEVWLDSHGWVRVDPARTLSNPRADQASIDGFGLVDAVEEDDRPEEVLPETSGAAPVHLRIESDTELLRGDENDMADAGWWERWLLDFDARRQIEMLEAAALEASWRGLVLIAGAAAAALAAAALVVMGVAQWIATRGLSPAERFCVRLERRLARGGLVRARAEGLQSFLERAGHAVGAEQAVALAGLGPMLRAALYGPTGHFPTLEAERLLRNVNQRSIDPKFFSILSHLYRNRPKV
ncbi:MAG: DUF3488 and transglutaminase-like domain-containing protein [Pseudomonadota bacterium]